MFGPGRHFPPAELREWERGERLDPEYQLSAKPPPPLHSPACLPAPVPEKSERVLQRIEKEERSRGKMEEEERGRDGRTDGRKGREGGVSQRRKWAK